MLFTSLKGIEYELKDSRPQPHMQALENDLDARRWDDGFTAI